MSEHSFIIDFVVATINTDVFSVLINSIPALYSGCTRWMFSVAFFILFRQMSAQSSILGRQVPSINFAMQYSNSDFLKSIGTSVINLNCIQEIPGSNTSWGFPFLMLGIFLSSLYKILVHYLKTHDNYMLTHFSQFDFYSHFCHINSDT